jgi:recombination protein RecA
VEFDIMYGTGISYTGELLDLAVQYEIIKKSGAWFSHGEERIGQGRDNAKAYLDEHPEIAVGIEAQVRQALTLPQVMSETLAASAQAASIDTDAVLFQDEFSHGSVGADLETHDARD